jgi:nitrate reductase NapD
MTICSLVIQANPDYIKAVNKSLNSVDGLEIHSQNKQGKLAITIDHPSREYCSKAITDITHIKGIMSTSLIFEYQEDLDDF